MNALRLTLLLLIIIGPINLNAQPCFKDQPNFQAKDFIKKKKFSEALELVNTAIEKDNRCTKALQLRLNINQLQKNEELCIKDLELLKNSPPNNVKELVELGDYSDSLKQNELSKFYYTRAFENTRENSNELLLKILKSRFKCGEIKTLLPSIDSLIHLAIPKKAFMVEVRRIQAEVYRVLYEKETEPILKRNLGFEARSAYSMFLKLQFQAIGYHEKLPKEFNNNYYCDIFFFMSCRYLDNNEAELSNRYINYLTQSSCDPGLRILGDSINYLNYLILGDEKHIQLYLHTILDKNPKSAFFLREDFKHRRKSGAHYLTAIEPLNRAVKNNSLDSASLILRARIFEINNEYEKAYFDLKSIRKHYGDNEFAEDYKRIYKLFYEKNREAINPKISLDNVEYLANNKFQKKIGVDTKKIILSGHLIDKSGLDSLFYNGNYISFKSKSEDEDTCYFEFIAEIKGSKTVLFFKYFDVYQNEDSARLSIVKESLENRSVLKIITPANLNQNKVKEIFIDSESSKNILFKGSIESPYNISSVNVNDINAVIKRGYGNAFDFETEITVQPTDSFVLVNYTIEDAETNYIKFRINNQDEQQSKKQISGRTWVVIISNSIYDNFMSLEGVGKDVNILYEAFKDYQIQNIVRKNNMNSKEMKAYLTRELKKEIQDAQVNTLILWYAGHGKYKPSEEEAYWIPTDAKSEDDIDNYFPISDLQKNFNKATNLNNLLVVSDACETGIAFLDAKRGEEQFGSCNSYIPQVGKSYYVLTSSLDRGTSDKSKLAELFASNLEIEYKNNSNCINVLDIAKKVQSNLKLKQDALFGKFAGIEGRNDGSFYLEKAK